jgi:hypothetical protein
VISDLFVGGAVVSGGFSVWSSSFRERLDAICL